MNLSQSYIANLLLKEMSGSLSEKESMNLKQWKQKTGASDEELKKLTSIYTLIQKVREYDEAHRRASTTRFNYEKNEKTTGEKGLVIPIHSKTNLLHRTWFRYAAVVLFLISVSVFLAVLKQRTSPDSQKNYANLKNNNTKEIFSGGNKAVLILADGSSIVLDSTENGTIALQGGSSITKLSNGIIRYDPKKILKDSTLMNTLSTPKGSTYQLTLPDGTKVWLNAMSTIKYPTAFITNKRTVELTGEAYFEVAKDATKPFHVLVSPKFAGMPNLDVQAIGTSFNINAYGDEPSLRTTLVEGSVKLNAGAGNERILKPGQQGIIGEHITGTEVKSVDTEKVIAWKNGYFTLDGTSIQDVMRQISRWYNVDVVYEGNFSGDDFAGHIPRSASLSKALKMLEMTGVVQFEIDNRKIIVSQKK